MSKYPFYWSYEGNAILVRGSINGEKPMTFLLDTGASNTSVDFNTLALIGYNFLAQ
jgi:predicted aspartyl protease